MSAEIGIIILLSMVPVFIVSMFIWIARSGEPCPKCGGKMQFIDTESYSERYKKNTWSCKKCNYTHSDLIEIHHGY